MNLPVAAEAAPPDPDRLPQQVALVWLVTSLLVGLVVRTVLALTDDGLYWPDEIHQSLEPAHRLVFGYGLVTWEFERGARNWVFPGILAGLLKFLDAVGVADPAIYVRVLKVLMAWLGSATALGVYAVARTHGATRISASAAAGLWSLLAPAIYFAPRMLGENASLLPLLLGWALLGRGTRHNGVWGAALLVVAVVLRPHNVVFCVVWLLVLAARRQGPLLARTVGVFVLGALALGLLDRLTWGSWFQSVVEYLRANVTQDVAAQWGSRDAFHYVRVLGRCMVLPLAVLLWTVPAAFATRARGLLLATLAFLVVHAWVPHKELRFILPALPLLCALCAVGLERWDGVVPGVRNTVAGMLVVVALASVAGHKRLTKHDLGLEDHVVDTTSAYDLGGPINRLLMKAWREPDLCGVMVTKIFLVGTGAYSHLHRNVWLHEARPETFEAAQFSHIIVEEENLGTERVDVRARDGRWLLARVLDRPCTPKSP